jgi:excisionase family DNA binding protein
MNKERKVLTTFQAAEYCLVSPFTVRNWVESEVLPAYRTPGGHRRILKEDLDLFLRKHGMPGPDVLGGVAKTVLVVDKDKTVTALVSKVVRQVDEKVRVETVHDGFEMGLLVCSLRPHVVVLDLKMPGLDGFKVCRKFKSGSLGVGSAILGTSTNYTAAVAKKFVKCGGWKLLKKPLDVDLLKVAISEALSIHWSARIA